MKKILFAVSPILFCFCISCNNSPTSTAESGNNLQAQKNLEASHVIAKAFETGDVSGVDSVLTSDFVDHTDQGDKKGADSLKKMVNMVHSNFADMKMETVKEIADSEYVFSWMRYSGTSSGAMGMTPGPYDMQAIEATKFKDGKAVEHWSFMDMREMGKMMQQMQSMSKMNKPDSSKMKK
jgi:predicted SnoaL-like aldol condensation-catalyzing enzyme